MKTRIAGLLVLCATIAALTPQHARAATVVSTETVLNRVFGVNLHLDNCCSGNYADLQAVSTQIQYIGARRLRDWPDRDEVLAAWRTVHAATGAPFHASIPETSPDHQRVALARMARWVQSDPGLIDVIEGGNEEDSPYAIQQGASLAASALLQQEVYATGKSLGIPVAQLSVGAGWAPPRYEGNYKNFGTPPADLGNAHTYMAANDPPVLSLKRIGELAAYSVGGNPVDVTEFGIYKRAGQADDVTSAYMHEAPFDAFALGYAGFFVYALHDDMSNVVSFYTSTGQPRAFADYWHHTTQLLADPAGKSLPPKTLALSFSGKTASAAPLGLKTLPMYKSDGSLWIAVYDEERQNVPDGSGTITFDKPHASVQVVDGRNGTVVTQYNNVASITLPLSANHVYFVVAR
jgi:hypothetical protein